MSPAVLLTALHLIGPPASLESSIVLQLNAVRLRPSRFSSALVEYRSRFDGAIVRARGSEPDEETEEGPAAVDEAIRALARLPAARPLSWDPALASAAAEHADDQAATGLVGHEGSNGDDFAGRMSRHVDGRRAVSEVISYGETLDVDVVRQLIVDDGVPGRDHRHEVFAPDVQRVGVACRPHPTYGVSCVIDMSS